MGEAENFINEINVAPSLVQPDTTINEMTPLSFSVSATDPDIPANALTFELVSGPPGLTVSPEGAVAWLPGEADGPAVYPVTVRVTDSNPDAVNAQHLSTTNTFNVTVREVNQPPVLALLADQTLHAGLTFTRTATATDKDIPTNILSFSLLSAPADMTITPEGGVITWPTSDAQANSTNFVVVQVADNGEPLLVATQSFAVIVVPRPALADVQFVTVEALVTNLDLTPQVASEFTTYPEVSWSAIVGARYGFQDTAPMGDVCVWHTNLFIDIPYLTATDTTATAWGPFVRRTIPAWGIDVTDPSASRFFRVQALP